MGSFGFSAFGHQPIRSMCVTSTRPNADGEAAGSTRPRVKGKVNDAAMRWMIDALIGGTAAPGEHVGWSSANNAWSKIKFFVFVKWLSPNNSVQKARATNSTARRLKYSGTFAVVVAKFDSKFLARRSNWRQTSRRLCKTMSFHSKIVEPIFMYLWRCKRFPHLLPFSRYSPSECNWPWSLDWENV